MKESGRYKDTRDHELVYAQEYPGWEEQLEDYLDNAMKNVTVTIK